LLLASSQLFQLPVICDVTSGTKTRNNERGTHSLAESTQVTACRPTAVLCLNYNEIRLANLKNSTHNNIVNIFRQKGGVNISQYEIIEIIHILLRTHISLNCNFIYNKIVLKLKLSDATCFCRTWPSSCNCSLLKSLQCVSL
jgi:hypothetical protein